jgi:hypothetical protein
MRDGLVVVREDDRWRVVGSLGVRLKRLYFRMLDKGRMWSGVEWGSDGGGEIREMKGTWDKKFNEGRL